MKITKHFYITGMHCSQCPSIIKKNLERLPGIIKISISYKTNTATITFHRDQISWNQITSCIKSLGYHATENKMESTQQTKNFLKTIAFILLLTIFLKKSQILNYLVPRTLAQNNMSFGMLFLIGLATSLHCVAMCGGINLFQCLPSSKQTTNKKMDIFSATLFYNIGRVLSYSTIGGFLGLIGMIFGKEINPSVSVFFHGTIKIIAGLIMILMGLRILDLMPNFCKKISFIPKFQLFKNQKKHRPFFVGLLNGFMPCGPLQSMQIVAIATCHPLYGALSMFFFSLGTLPFMLGFGSMISVLGHKFTSKMMHAGSILIIVMGIAMLTQGTNLSGMSSIRLEKKATSSRSTHAEKKAGEKTSQIIHSTLSAGSYPNITVKAGTPVIRKIQASEQTINGCNKTILIDNYNIEKVLEPGENTIKFTPKETGTITYTCWMGMITGTITITD